MKKQIFIGSVILSVLVALAFAAQDKYSVKVPGGLAFSEFRGYEDWSVIAISQNGPIRYDAGKSRNDRRL
jgi:hypothetical protein